MALPFRHTIRTLEHGRGRPWLWAGTACVILGCWLVWSMVTRVAIYRSSLHGRIESREPARPIQVPVAGVVTRWQLSLGRRVAAGEVLVQLDTTSLELELRA